MEIRPWCILWLFHFSLHSGAAVPIEGSFCFTSDIHPVENDASSYVYCNVFIWKKASCGSKQIFDHLSLQCVGTKSDSTVRVGADSSSLFRRQPIDICPNGQRHYVSRISGQPQSCQISGPSTCPDSFYCHFSRRFGRHLCCSLATDCPTAQSFAEVDARTGGPRFCRAANSGCSPGFACESTTRVCCSTADPTVPDSQLCPAGERVALWPGTQRPRACVAGRRDCPAAFACRQGPTTRFYCCTDASSSSGACPLNSSPYLQAGVALQCTAASNDCPNGYVCHTNSQRIQHCCANPCPTLGSLPYYLPATNQYHACAVGANQCSTGYTCQSRSSTTTGFCCSGGTTTTQSYCPLNSRPWYYPNSQTAVACSLGSTGACPLSTSCMQGPSGGSYCCFATSNPCVPNPCGQNQRCVDGAKNCFTTPCPQYRCEDIAAGQCIPGYYPKTIGGSVVACYSQNQLTCRSPDRCLFSISYRRYICCTASNSGTGSNVQATSDPYCPQIISGAFCTPGVSGQCAQGFFCQFNTALTTYRCCRF